MPTDIPLAAHLLRRAGFGASLDELEAYSAKDYEEIVDDLIHPERLPEIEEDTLKRYYSTKGGIQARWNHRILNTHRPLQEKMVLFWHQLFPTSTKKSGHILSSFQQIDTFRRFCLTNIRTILCELSKDPAMIFWLDNNENLKEAPNENYGRELLELFSMGVGNYTEEDVKGATSAFTGWTFVTPTPGVANDRFPAEFKFRGHSHNDGSKSFLGETARLNGEDIIDVIVRQPATARFMARHMYTFFVADEPPVASWNEIPPKDPEAIDTLTKAYFDSEGDLRSILETLFLSDFFKEARFKRVKSPIELVMGILKLTGTCQEESFHNVKRLGAFRVMGQSLLAPETVEGWRTGPEWIDGGKLSTRIDFAVGELSDSTAPGIKNIVYKLSADSPMSPEEFVDKVLKLAGPVNVNPHTHKTLVQHAESSGPLDFNGGSSWEKGEQRVVRMLQLITSTREYQFG